MSNAAFASRMHVEEQEVVEMEQRLSGRGAELSLDAPVDRGAETSATHGVRADPVSCAARGGRLPPR